MRFLVEDKTIQLSDKDYKNLTKYFKDNKIKYKDVDEDKSKQTNKEKEDITKLANNTSGSLTPNRDRIQELKLQNAQAKLFKKCHKYYNEIKESNKDLPTAQSDNGYKFIKALAETSLNKGLIDFLRNSDDIPKRLGDKSTDVVIKLISNGMLSGEEPWLQDMSLMTSENDDDTAFKIKCMTLATSQNAQDAYYDEGDLRISADKFRHTDENGNGTGYMTAQEMRDLLDARDKRGANKAARTTPKTGYQIISKAIGKDIAKKPTTSEVNQYLSRKLPYFKDDLLKGIYNNSLSDILANKYPSQVQGKKREDAFIDAVEARLTSRRQERDYRNSNNKNTLPNDPSKDAESGSSLKTSSQKLADNQAIKVDY